jgi:hypothetical protein
MWQNRPRFEGHQQRHDWALDPTLPFGHFPSLAIWRAGKMGEMPENPYSPPDHYATRPKPPVPVIAYALAASTLIAGVAVTALGFYFLMPRTTLGGMSVLGFGIFLVSVIVKYRRQPQ